MPPLTCIRPEYALVQQIAERFGVPSLGELMAKGKLPSGKLTLNVRAGADNDHEVEISPEGEQSVHTYAYSAACLWPASKLVVP